MTNPPQIKIKERIIETFILVFILYLVSTFVGCGKKETEKENKIPIKVAFWGSPEEIEIITNSINVWQRQKEHQDIRVILEHTPYTGYVSKILTRIAGRAAPDIICVEVNLFTTFCNKDVFLDLKPSIEKDKQFNLNEFFPEVVKRFTVDGKIYSIPRDTAPFACVYYNKKLFDEAGVDYPTDDWDWYELLDKAQKLTKREGKRVIQYGFYGWAWQNFIYSNGGGIVDNVNKPTRCTLYDSRALEGLQFFTDLMNKYKVAPTSSDIKNLGMGAQQMFMTGKLAMFSSGIWETPILRKIKDFDWDIVMFPKGPTGIRGFGTGGSGYCILKTTKYPNEAWEIIKALSGDEAQIMLAESGLAQPANRRIAEGPHWAENPKPPTNKKMLNEAVKYVTYEPFHPYWREIQELYINPEFDLLFNGEETATEAVEKILPKINELLKNID